MNDARRDYLLAFLLAATIVYCGVRWFRAPISEQAQTIAQQIAVNDQRIDADNRWLTQFVQNQKQERDDEKKLNIRSMIGAPTDVWARLLSALVSLARNDDVVLGSSTAQSGFIADNPPKVAAQTAQQVDPYITRRSASLNVSPINIKVSGHYSNVLRFMRDISKAPVLIGIDDYELTRTKGNSDETRDPSISVQAKISLFRVVTP